MIGQPIGRYIIRSKLAEGGMGAVYVAEHEKLLNKRKVIKVLLGEFSRHEVVRQRFEREALAASRIKDEHVIDVDDFGALPDGQLFLMMPFVEGNPLDKHIAQSGKLTLHHTLHIAVQICLALDSLHAAGLIHRDLKPGNVLLTRTQDNPYFVKLIDLGIARDLAEHAASFKTNTGMAMGTPGYMAVEQYLDAASVTPASDLYALAIMTWEMLTGVMPWGVHPAAVYFHVQQQMPEPPPDHTVPPDVLALLRRMLAPRPQDRLQTAREFAIAFASLVPALPPHVPSGAETLRRYAKRFTEGAGPDLETVRAANVDASRAVPMLWPHRQTGVPAPAPSAPAPAHAISMPTALNEVSTVNERPPQHGTSPPQANLGASRSVAITRASQSSKRGLIVLLVMALAAIVAGLGFIVSRRQMHEELAPAARDHTDPDAQGIEPSDAAIERTTSAGQPAAHVASQSDAASQSNAATAPTASPTPSPHDASLGVGEAAPAAANAGNAQQTLKRIEHRPKRESAKTTPPTDRTSGSSTPRSSARLDPDAVAE
jgi:serine/threonine-protein kinase